MANVFDQFDGGASGAPPPTSSAAGAGVPPPPPTAGNVFDQFDAAPSVITAVSPAASPPAGAPTKIVNANPMAIQRPRGQPQPTGYTPSAVPALDPVSAFANAAVNQIPVVGPALTKAGNSFDAWLNNLVGFPTEGPADRAAIDSAQAKQFPGAAATGEMAGAVAPYVALGATGLGAKALGLGEMATPAQFAGNTLASGASNFGISYLDSLARGANSDQAMKNAELSGVAGSVLPGAGKALGWAFGNTLAPIAKTAFGAVAPQAASDQMVGRAYARDLASGAPVMSAEDASAAIARGQPIVNGDIGGANVRSLARAAANVDPSAKAVLDNTVQERFASQAPRTVDFINSLMNGQVDDLAYQNSLRDAAQKANKPAYAAAYNAPQAQRMWGPQYQQLMQSQDFRDALKGANRTALNDAALNGSRPVGNPFVFGDDGSVSLAKNADGSVAMPTLQYWDIVQRGLRNSADQASRAGDNLGASQIGGLRSSLLNVLDSQVPQFQQARQGAAAFFGAQDALDAGKSFANQPKNLPEAQAAYGQFNPAEKNAFATGYASSLIDNVKAAGDRTDVINRYFGSPASRQMAQLALGPDRASQLEAFTRTEQVMGFLKNAVTGNSTTAQQLIAAGLIGGGVGGYEGDWNLQSIATGAGLAALGRQGASGIARGVDEGVMKRVADTLASQDQNKISLIIRQATKSAQTMGALRAIQTGVGAAMKGGATAGVDARGAPSSTEEDVGKQAG